MLFFMLGPKVKESLIFFKEKKDSHVKKFEGKT